MGCGPSRDATVIDTKEHGSETATSGQVFWVVDFNKKSSHVFNRMGLKKKYSSELYSLFCRHHNKDVGRIDMPNFLKAINLPLNPFSELLFSRFALTNEASLSPLEFICSVWNFLSFHDRMVGPYVFFLHDKRDRGFVSIETMRKMMQLIREHHHAQFNSIDNSMLNRDTQNFLHSTDVKKKGHLTLSRFHSWCNSHLNMLDSIVESQAQCRQHVMTEDFWLGEVERRQKNPALRNANHVLHVLKEVLMEESAGHKTRGSQGGSKSGKSTKSKGTKHITVASQAPADSKSSKSSKNSGRHAETDGEVDRDDDDPTSREQVSLREQRNAHNKKTAKRKAEKKAQEALNMARRSSRVVGNIIGLFGSVTQDVVREDRRLGGDGM